MVEVALIEVGTPSEKIVVMLLITEKPAERNQ